MNSSSLICKAFLLVCLLGAVFAEEFVQSVPYVATSSAKLAPPSEVSEETRQELVAEALRLAEEQLLEEEADRAAYSFRTSLVDGIMDNQQNRTETRNGKNVTGSYSYSDGWFHHVINYVADQFGYRIVSEKTEAIGAGPKLDIDGTADVRTSIAGQDFEYTITKNDIGRLRELKNRLLKKVEPLEQSEP